MAEIPAERAVLSENASPYSLNMINGTVGIIPFSTRAASRPFITGVDEVQHNHVGMQFLSPFDRFLPIFCFSAYFKIRLRFEERVRSRRITALSSTTKIFFSMVDSSVVWTRTTCKRAIAWALDAGRPTMRGKDL